MPGPEAFTFAPVVALFAAFQYGEATHSGPDAERPAAVSGLHQFRSVPPTAVL